MTRKGAERAIIVAALRRPGVDKVSVLMRPQHSTRRPALLDNFGRALLSTDRTCNIIKDFDLSTEAAFDRMLLCLYDALLLEQSNNWTRRGFANLDACTTHELARYFVLAQNARKTYILWHLAHVRRVAVRQALQRRFAVQQVEWPSMRQRRARSPALAGRVAADLGSTAVPSPMVAPILREPSAGGLPTRPENQPALDVPWGGDALGEAVPHNRRRSLAMLAVLLRVRRSLHEVARQEDAADPLSRQSITMFATESCAPRSKFDARATPARGPDAGRGFGGRGADDGGARRA